MEATLTTGSIAKTLLRLTSPQVLGFFAVISLNMVDTYFIAQLGVAELAAVTFTFPVVMLLMNAALGLSIGAGSVISRTIGAGKCPKALTTASLLLGIFAMLGINMCPMDGLFTLMGTPHTLFRYVKAYMDIWFLGLPVLVVPMIANAAISASGDTKMPALIMITAALTNLFLDPLLIFGYGLETEGAAWATVISYGIACLLSLLCLYRKKMLTHRFTFSQLLSSWKRVLSIGVPASATQMLIPLSNAGSLWMLSRFGSSVIAAYGIVCRLESFSLIVIMALGMSLSAFVGQNHGAKEYARVQKALTLSYLFAFFWGCLLALVFTLSAAHIAAVFNADAEVIETVVLFLTLVPLTYGALGCVFLANAYFNAVGKPFQASLITVSRHFVLYLPTAYIAMLYFGPVGVFSAMALVNVLAAVTVLMWSSRSVCAVSL